MWTRGYMRLHTATRLHTGTHGYTRLDVMTHAATRVVTRLIEVVVVRQVGPLCLAHHPLLEAFSRRLAPLFELEGLRA